MRIRQLWLVLVMLSIPTVASADGHRAIFGGPSIRSGSVLFGVHAAFDVALPKESVAVGADFSWYSDDSDSTIFAVDVRFRPGYSIQAQSTRNYFVGFHALAGAVRQDGDTSGAFGVGFSNDFVIKRPAKGTPLFLRIQLDVIDAQETFGRLSVGLLRHW